VDKGRAAKALTQPENKVFKQLPPCLNGISKCLKSWVLQLIYLARFPEKFLSPEILAVIEKKSEINRNRTFAQYDSKVYPWI
jgi:hypothetical protein